MLSDSFFFNPDSILLMFVVESLSFTRLNTPFDKFTWLNFKLEARMSLNLNFAESLPTLSRVSFSVDITAMSFAIILLKKIKCTFPTDTPVFSFSDKTAVTLATVRVCTDGICRAR